MSKLCRISNVEFELNRVSGRGPEIRDVEFVSNLVSAFCFGVLYIKHKKHSVGLVLGFRIFVLGFRLFVLGFRQSFVF